MEPPDRLSDRNSGKRNIRGTTDLRLSSVVISEFVLLKCGTTTETGYPHIILFWNHLYFGTA
jgi:hypothetical protein